MISLEYVRACSNPKCRLVLPADPEDELSAGFWVARRAGGPGSRVTRWQAWCKLCSRERSRRDNGIRRRGRPYEARVPQDKEARARYLAERLEMLQEKRREGMADPRYAAAYRAKQRERARVRRRRKGMYPRDPERREERLPLGPLTAFLDATSLSTRELARRLDLSEDRVRHLRRNYYYHKTKAGEMRRYEATRVSFPFALRVAREFDVGMGEIWPEVFGE